MPSETLEATKGILCISNSTKDRPDSGRKKTNKKTNNYRQNTTQKTIDWATPDLRKECVNSYPLYDHTWAAITCAHIFMSKCALVGFECFDRLNVSCNKMKI